MVDFELETFKTQINLRQYALQRATIAQCVSIILSRAFLAASAGYGSHRLTSVRLVEC